MKTGDGATHRGFESHSLRQQKSAPIRGHFFVNEEAGFERATQAQPGEKLSGGQFLARGRIPAFPNAVRRTVGGKANAINPAPIRGHFFVNEEAGFERATQAQPGEKCPVDIILCESSGLLMSLHASAHTGVAPSRDSLRSQSVSKAFPSGVVLRAANQNLTIASGNCSIMYRWLARLPQARDG